MIARPRLDVVHKVVSTLAERSVVTALGGSGLLAALGLVERVRDWDLTTDAEPHLVRSALGASGLAWEAVAAGDKGFASRARLAVDGGDHEVDLIVGFAVRDGSLVVPLPTRVTGSWLGLPLGDPEVWARAYRLMGREPAATTLEAWLRRPFEPGGRSAR